MSEYMDLEGMTVNLTIEANNRRSMKYLPDAGAVGNANGESQEVV